MLLAALPDWLDPELLQWIILVVIAVLLYLMYVVVRFVQRADLENCARTCECSLYGQTVEVPWEQLPDDLRVRLADGEVGCRVVPTDA